MYLDFRITARQRDLQNGVQDLVQGGRQKRRWRDDLTYYFGTTWTRQAQDRRRWQLLEEGYIQHARA